MSPPFKRLAGFCGESTMLTFVLGMLAGVLVWSAFVVNQVQTLAGDARQIVEEFLDSLPPFFF